MNECVIIIHIVESVATAMPHLLTVYMRLMDGLPAVDVQYELDRFI